MNEQAVRRLTGEVLAGIAPEADLAAVTDSEDLREALDLDSMDFLNFVIALGEKTGVSVPEADMGQLRTMKGLLAYLVR